MIAMLMVLGLIRIRGPAGLVIIGGTVAGGLAACRAAVCPGDGLVLPFMETPW